MVNVNPELQTIAATHARMVEVCIITGDREKAHAAIERAFGECSQDDKVTEDTVLSELLTARMASIFERNGYHQGDDTVSEPTPCEVCGKAVSKSRSWWRQIDPELREYDCYCRPCAMFRVFAVSDNACVHRAAAKDINFKYPRGPRLRVKRFVIRHSESSV